MTKLQTKTQNLTLKIQKLARVLNKFSVDDIQQLIPATKKEILESIKVLVTNNTMKQLSSTEFIYTKFQQKTRNTLNNVSKEEQIFEEKTKNLEWLTIEEVMALTKQKRETIRRKCKSNTYKSISKQEGRYKIYLIKKILH